MEEPGLDREKTAIGDSRADVLHAWRKISTCLDTDFNFKRSDVHLKISEAATLESNQMESDGVQGQGESNGETVSPPVATPVVSIHCDRLKRKSKSDVCNIGVIAVQGHGATLGLIGPPPVKHRKEAHTACIFLCNPDNE